MKTRTEFKILDVLMPVCLIVFVLCVLVLAVDLFYPFLNNIPTSDFLNFFSIE